MVDMNRFYVKKVEINGKDFVEISNNEELKNIINKITEGEIKEVAFYGKDKNIILNIFADVNKFHIGIIDEDEGMNYYYFNSNVNNEELIDIDGNYFDANMICYNQNTLESIIIKFVVNGEKYEEVEWIEEEE